MPMLDPSHPISQLLQEDPRFKLEAYAFVFEALNYAHDELGLGTPSSSEKSQEKFSGPTDVFSEQPAESDPETKQEEEERHLTGQQLCEAIRLYALEQFGYMAKCVLNSWGIRSTGDLGELVFNLIRIGQMRKRPEDRREDFENVFDFETGLDGAFEITMPEGD